jgi:hypothetical protein
MGPVTGILPPYLISPHVRLSHYTFLSVPPPHSLTTFPGPPSPLQLSHDFPYISPFMSKSRQLLRPTTLLTLLSHLLPHTSPSLPSTNPTTFLTSVPSPTHTNPTVLLIPVPLSFSQQCHHLPHTNSTAFPYTSPIIFLHPSHHLPYTCFITFPFTFLTHCKKRTNKKFLNVSQRQLKSMQW